MKRFLSIGIFCTLALLSCSKKETTPDPDDKKSVLDKLFNDIQGRWDFNAPAVLKRKAAIAGRRTQRILIKSRFIETNVQKKQSSQGFLEFTSDSTYVIYDTEGNFFSGKFEVKDGTTISLKNFGSIKNIKFSNNAISFMISYKSPEKTIEIAANKAAPVAADDRTRKLCFSWLLSKEKDGKELYESGYDYYNEVTDEYETRSFDKITIQFSIFGTYLVQISNKGELLAAEVANWRWHYKNTDKIVYWWEDELTQAQEDENNTTIIKNTDSALEVLDFYSDAGSEEKFNYVLSRIK